MSDPASEPTPAPDLRRIRHDLLDHLAPISLSTALIRLIPGQDPRVIQAVEVIERQARELTALADRLAPGSPS